MAQLLDLSPYTGEELVERLATPHYHKQVLQRLIHFGQRYLDAVREGLQHPSADVRIGCCKVLDHHMDEAALPGLIDNLSHPNAGVRTWALHALACDRCKEGTCRPGEADVIPRVIRVLREDTNRHCRQMAAGMLGPSVHRSPAALAAIEWAYANDAHPAVRKVASWWIPGGTRFEKLKKRERSS